MTLLLFLDRSYVAPWGTGSIGFWKSDEKRGIAEDLRVIGFFVNCGFERGRIIGIFHRRSNCKSIPVLMH
jgi:hypothetical protein